MTISTTTSRVSYTANGSTDVFAYTFKIFSDSEIKVYVDNVLKTLTTHYTVSGEGESSGGNVTFTTGNTPANLEIVALARNIARTQATDYVENDSFPAETHEAALDKLTMLVQDVDNTVTGDIFRFSESVTDAGTVTITKTAAQRASKLLAFDTSGDLQATQEIGVYQGNWAASTAYAIRDLIKDTSNNNIYICNTAHTSSGSQPISSNADVAKWTLIVDAASATSSATSAASSATTATAQAVIATAKAVLTASDATDTAADLVLTNADVVLTNADVVLTNADVVSAEAAKVAAEGATGASAFKFTFDSSTTMADPGTGELRLNHATVASVTSIAFDAVSADTSNPDVSDFIASWDDGSNSAHEGYITIRKSGTPATYAVFSLTGAVTDSTGWLQCPVTHVDSNGSWTNGDTMFTSFSRSGDKGNTGTLAVGTVTGNTVTVGNPATAAVANSGSSTAATFDFTFGIPTGATGARGSDAGLDMTFESTTTDTDQGVGKVWFNHGTLSSATVLYMDDVDANSASINSWVDSWDDSTTTALRGTVKVVQQADPAIFALYNVTGAVTSASTYSKIPVSYVTGAGSFSDTDSSSVSFFRTGNTGSAGSSTPSDAVFRIQDNSDATKEIAFEASGITTGTTRTITMPDSAVTLVSSGAIVNADINGSAAIVTSKLSGAVTSIASHGLATSATTDTTSASNISSGTLPDARLNATMNPTLTTTGKALVMGF